MPAIKGVIRSGQVVLPEAANWPDGAEVTVQLPDRASALTPSDEEGPMTPEEIARTLAAMENVEPLEMTDEERADIAAWRQRVKEYTIANMDKGLEELFPVRRYLLDTGIAGDYLDRRRGVYERARAEVSRGNPVGICLPVLAELAYGVEWSAGRDRNRERLKRALASWKVWPVTEAADFEYGRLAAELRRIGRVIQQNDIMIAAIARTLGNCTVVSADSDLTAVPGLAVENWATP